MRFDKAFCINLDNKPENWTSAQNEFKKINIDVERFSAIENPTKTEYNKVYSFKNDILTKNNYASFQSHLSIIKLAKQQGLKNVLIFEDDVFFTKNAKQIFNSAINELPNNWDFLSLGGWIRGTLKMHSDHLFRYYSGWLTHGYALNHTLFDFIIENGAPSTDNFYKEQVLPYYKCYMVIPIIALQKNNISTINPNRNISPYEAMIKYNPEIWNKINSIYMKRNITLTQNVFDDGYNNCDDS